jgi:hypothetical protein
MSNQEVVVVRLTDEEKKLADGEDRAIKRVKDERTARGESNDNVKFEVIIDEKSIDGRDHKDLPNKDEAKDNAPSEQDTAVDGSPVPNQTATGDANVITDSGSMPDVRISAEPEVAAPGLRYVAPVIPIKRGFDTLVVRKFTTQRKELHRFSLEGQYPTYSTEEERREKVLIFKNDIINKFDAIRLSPETDANPLASAGGRRKITDPSAIGFSEMWSLLLGSRDALKDAVINDFTDLRNVTDDENKVKVAIAFCLEDEMKMMEEFHRMRIMALSEIDHFYGFLRGFEHARLVQVQLPVYDPRLTKMMIGGPMLSLNSVILRNEFMFQEYNALVTSIVKNQISFARTPGVAETVTALTNTIVTNIVAVSENNTIPQKMAAGRGFELEYFLMTARMTPQTIGMTIAGLEMGFENAASILGCLFFKMFVPIYALVDIREANKVDNYLYQNFFKRFPKYDASKGIGWDLDTAENGDVNYLTRAYDVGAFNKMDGLKAFLEDLFLTSKEGKGWAHGGRFARIGMRKGGNGTFEGVINADQRDFAYIPTHQHETVSPNAQWPRLERLAEFSDFLQSVPTAQFAYNGPSEKRIPEIVSKIIKHVLRRRNNLRQRAFKLDRAAKFMGMSSLFFGRHNSDEVESPLYTKRQVAFTPADVLNVATFIDYESTEVRSPDLALIGAGYHEQNVMDEFLDKLNFVETVFRSDLDYTTRNQMKIAYQMMPVKSAMLDSLFNNILIDSYYELVSLPKIKMPPHLSIATKMNIVNKFVRAHSEQFGYVEEFVYGSVETKDDFFRRRIVERDVPETVDLDIENIRMYKMNRTAYALFQRAQKGEINIRVKMPITTEDIFTTNEFAQRDDVVDWSVEGLYPKINMPLQQYYEIDDDENHVDYNNRVYERRPNWVARPSFFEMEDSAFLRSLIQRMTVNVDSFQIWDVNDSRFSFEFTQI